jgi:hypothetical protein
MNHDYAIEANMGLPTGAPKLQKPPYLVILALGKGFEYFIADNRPETINSFVQVKGIFVNGKSETDIVASYADIIYKAPKEEILEMMFPIHRVHSIRSLTYNAVKRNPQR